jgi:hypothetical protein
MTDSQFIVSSLITAYVLGWTFGTIFLIFRKFTEDVL